MYKLRKHKALEEQYDHYICEFCMEIGAKEIISDFIKNIDEYLDSMFVNKESIDYKYWEGRKKIWEKINK